MKLNAFKKILTLGLLLETGLVQYAHSSELTTQDNLSIEAVKRNFEDSKTLIHECLEDAKDVQLHFFWTTGKTLSDNPTYNPVTQVNVGGASYGHKFFPCVRELLHNSPEKLKIKFVCDQMTLNSNLEHIQSLQSMFGDRFAVLSIDNVISNILKTFNSGDQAETLEPYFKNATHGTPVLASDVYRIIGMIYGQENFEVAAGTMRTYSDIDVFCYAMEHGYHVTLLESMFRFRNTSPFYFGRKNNNNDIIKICIQDLAPYKQLCDRLIKKLNLNGSIITHFSKLHDIIKMCEDDLEYCSQVMSYLPKPKKRMITDVVYSTGPGFLYDDKIIHDLRYVSETVGSWFTSNPCLDDSEKAPSKILNWGHLADTPEEKSVCDQFTKDCDAYRKILSTYNYSKEFGKNHPFNIMMTTYLIDHHPYHLESFQNMLRVNFNQKLSNLNFDIQNKEVPQYYKVRLMEDFPVSKVKDRHKKKIYVQKNGEKIYYKALTPEGDLLEGNLDINVQSDDAYALLEYENIILQKSTEMGVKLSPKKEEVFYEEWKNKTFKGLQKNRLHYKALARILGKLDIKIDPLTRDDIDFKKNNPSFIQ